MSVIPIAELSLDALVAGAVDPASSLITAGFCFVAWRRSGYSRSMGLLELLRLALVCHRGRHAQPAGVGRGIPPGGEAGRRRALGRLAQHGDARRRGQGQDAASSPQTRREAVAPLAESASWAEAARADERRGPAVLAGPGRTRHRPARAAGPGASRRSRTCAASCWPPTATGTRGRRRCRPRPGCGSRACPSSPSPWAARPACPTSSCSASTPRPSASPASRFASRSRSKAPCRASMSPPSSSGRPTATS